MLRSLYSGISGLHAHQTMLDVTANNIANVNTTGFKSSSVEFQDTLSQLISGGTGATSPETGSTNPAQIGLGVRVAAIATNFTEGSAESTGKQTDLMINGDGFFQVQTGGQTQYTRDGSLSFDTQGRLVTSDGAFVQGWTATNGAISDSGAVGNITLPMNSIAAAKATTTATLTGNLPDDAATGTAVERDIPVEDANGVQSNLPLTFTKNATGWDVNDGTATIGTVTYNNGVLSSPGTMTTTSGITINVSGTTGYAGINSLQLGSVDGSAAGTLESYTIGNDGTITGTYSNGTTSAIARIAVASFTNPGGLEKAGDSTYTATASSGTATVTTAGTNGTGNLSSGYLEMSNVDLSQEFTNLIVAQRGFQANARIITTSDQILQELVALTQ